MFISCTKCNYSLMVNPHNTNDGRFKCPECNHGLEIEGWVQYMRKVKIDRIMSKMDT